MLATPISSDRQHQSSPSSRSSFACCLVARHTPSVPLILSPSTTACRVFDSPRPLNRPTAKGSWPSCCSPLVIDWHASNLTQRKHPEITFQHVPDTPAPGSPKDCSSPPGRDALSPTTSWPSPGILSPFATTQFALQLPSALPQAANFFFFFTGSNNKHPQFAASQP